MTERTAGAVMAQDRSMLTKTIPIQSHMYQCFHFRSINAKTLHSKLEINKLILLESVRATQPIQNNLLIKAVV